MITISARFRASQNRRPLCLRLNALRWKAEMNALKRLRLELADVLARNHLEVDAAKTMLDNAHSRQQRRLGGHSKND